jgi:hypothetical protein
MEYRRRTLSSLDDENIIAATVETGRRRRGTSASIDSQLDDYVEYMYSNTYNLSTSVFSGILNLICPCFRRKLGPDISTSSL